MDPSDKILDKLSKLRRHADSAKEIGNEQEAQAFAAYDHGIGPTGDWCGKIDCECKGWTVEVRSQELSAR